MHQLAQTVLARCDELAALSVESGRLTRPSFTPAMRAAHDLVAGWMRAAGMSVYEDNAGNLSGTYLGNRSNAHILLIGSHLDTVRDAGRYDGILGVLIGLACVERLAASGRTLPFSLEVTAFTDEEGLRFQKSFIGSKAYVGQFDRAWLDGPDADGVTLRQAMLDFGGEPDLIEQDARKARDFVGYCEVHIEQGPILEAQGLPVGVVTAITGTSRARIELRGSAGHAGTTPMHLRRDALAAAAECVLAAETLARETPGLVATVGQIEARPGASNVIPGAVTLSLDLRHQDDAVRQHAVATLRAQMQALTAARNIDLAWHAIQDTAAVPCHPELRERVARAIRAEGIESFALPSGAGHDAAVLGSFIPAAMLFVRCKDGISHNPAEAVDAADVAIAISVMQRLIDDLATSLS